MIQSTTTPLPLSDVKPDEELHDGNVCEENEELYGELCYAKCDALTSGRAPIRTSSWTCCANHPCYPWREEGSIGRSLLCKGFDVSGSGACPHKPGACFLNEEMHLGVCYKKCTDLTNGRYPYRSAAATCCKAKGFRCID